MAKKKDDNIDSNDELNEQHGGDFNDGDDNFGLPEVDYKPLDEQETVSEEEQQPADENVDREDTPEEETTMSQVNLAETEDDTSYDSSSDYDTTSDSDDYPETYADDQEELEENNQEQEYVPGSYTPPEDDESNAGKIIGLIVILVLAGLAIWFFGFYKPGQDAKQKARIEQQKEDQKRKAEAKRLEEEKRKQEEADREAQRLAEEEAAAEPEQGTVETIPSRTGRYYVVVASAIDGDLAMDYANRLAGEGNQIKIIPPFGNAKFHRVTIDSGDTWAEAENRANDLKGQYGDDVWVIRY